MPSIISLVKTGLRQIHVLFCEIKLSYVCLWCDNAEVKVWLGLGTTTTWLGLEKNHGLD